MNVKQITAALAPKLFPLVDRLAARWADESEYEDLKEYQTTLQKTMPKGCTITRMTKRPFGFEFKHEKLTFVVKATAKAILVEEVVGAKKTLKRDATPAPAAKPTTPAKKSSKVTVDFTNTAPAGPRVTAPAPTHVNRLLLHDPTGVFIEGTRHFVLVKEGRDYDHYLTLEEGAYKVVKVGKESEVRKRWRPYNYTPAEAARIAEKSFLPKTADAARAICQLQGKPVAAETPTTPTSEGEKPTTRKRTVSAGGGTGYSLAQMCEELSIEPFDARKLLREKKVQKPGSRWEWPTKDAAKDVIKLLTKGEGK